MAQHPNSRASSTTLSAVNGSGTVTLGGTAQELFAENKYRLYFFIQNISTGDLWIDFGATAVADQPSIKLVAGASFVMEGSAVFGDAVSIIGATTGQKFVAKQG